MNSITMQLQADKLIRMALEEDITSEDVSTNAVMPTKVQGTVDLIAKEDGVIAGMDVYARVFKLLDEDTEIEMFCHDGDEVREGDLMAKVTGDIRVLLSGERVALNYLCLLYTSYMICPLQKQTATEKIIHPEYLYHHLQRVDIRKDG